MPGKKRVLVIGGGGREHALATALARSTSVGEIFCIPGNPGISAIAHCQESPGDVRKLALWAKEQAIDLTIVGPEAYLDLGIADVFAQEGLLLFGPTKQAAQLETSKLFAKEFMSRQGIPTAAYQAFDDYSTALAYLETQKFPLVIKADGLAAGKGVVIAHDRTTGEKALREMMIQRVFGHAGSKVIIEEFLEGEEATILAFCDGERFLPMPAAQDHKRVFDRDQGPNTGGMGAYSPAPNITPQIAREIEENIFQRVIRGMQQEGNPYRGVLYLGLMLTEKGPQVVEFNCRFGDPETQVILPLLKSDLYPVLEAAALGNLSGIQLQWDSRWAVCVIMASGGYPGSYQVGYPITGIENQDPGVFLYHAGTGLKDGQLVTNGGRVLGVTALGIDFTEARQKAYGVCQKIHFQDCHYRTDIGWQVSRSFTAPSET